MSTAKIMERIGALIKYPLSKSKINRAMSKLGFQGVRKFSRGFRVMLLTQEEMSMNQIVKTEDQLPEEPQLKL